MLKDIRVRTHNRTEFVDITSNIQSIVKESQIYEGMCHVYVPHTTAAITINENADSSVVRDMIKYLNDKVSPDMAFEHSEGNSDAHIKSSLIGSSESVIISNNVLKLGTWQGIFFCEFDGPRTRSVFVKITG